MDNEIKLLMAGLVLGAVFALIAFMGLGVNPLLVTASTSMSQSPATSATIRTYVDTSITPSTITFGTLDPGTNNNNATSNPLNITNTANSNTGIDIFLQGSNLTNGSNVIAIGNLSVSMTDGGVKTALVEAPSNWINGSGSGQAYYADLAKNTTTSTWFYLTIPVSQNEGDYIGNVTIKSVKKNTAP